MDVHEIDNLYQEKSSSSNKIKKDSGFKQVFDQKLSEINATTARAFGDSKADVLGHSDRILDLLDAYVRGLTDPGKTEAWVILQADPAHDNRPR